MHIGELEVFYNKIQSEKSIYMTIWRARHAFVMLGTLPQGSLLYCWDNEMLVMF